MPADVYQDTVTAIEGDHSAKQHFRLYLRLLTARISENIYRHLAGDALHRVLKAYPFLATVRGHVATSTVEASLTEFEATVGQHLPLRALRTELHLHNDALMLLLAAGIIEEDLRLGALFAALQAPLNSRRPCLGLLKWLIAGADTGDIDAWAVAATLTRHGLVGIAHDDALSHLEWTVRVPLPIWKALRGDVLAHPAAQLRRQPASDFPPLDDLILPDQIKEQCARIPEMIAGRTVRALVLRGMTGSGRRTTLGTLARAVGRDVLLGEHLPEQERGILGPLATLTHAIPVIRLQADPGETITLDRLPGYEGVIGICMGRFGGIDGPIMENTLSLTLPPPDRQGRARFWWQSGVALDGAEAGAIIDHCLLTGGRIHHVAQLAHHYTQLDGRDGVTRGDVQTALRAINRQALETLATPLSPVDGWSRLVVHPRLEAELRMLEARCRGREDLLNHVGSAFDNNLNRGVRVLLNGPSGTGKTYAVRALAGALMMDLYRVDLAGIVNKYIGETEKNLNRVFTYAEELDVILLLDEGDSLMTRRTDVNGANDRYANLETNYLLQRLENYEGIIVITSNAAQRIDQAFIRRLDVVIEFAAPKAEQRRWLWHVHLPESHAITQRFLDRVIERCDLTGGQIRNAALHASLLALHRDAVIEDAEFEEALRHEYQKISLPYPLA